MVHPVTHRQFVFVSSFYSLNVFQDVNLHHCSFFCFLIFVLLLLLYIILCCNRHIIIMFLATCVCRFTFLMPSVLFLLARSQNCEKRLLAFSCPSVHLSVLMQQLGYYWTDFDENLLLSFLRKSVMKIQVSLKPFNNNGYFTLIRFHIYDSISLNSSWNEKRFR
jgi:hypothetical protein